MNLGVEAAAAAIRRRSNLEPLVGLILGSGLGALAELVESPTLLPYSEIPDHPRPGVPGHIGHLLLGWVETVPIAVWQGRVHFYEGWSMADVSFPVRLLSVLGGKAVVLTNAAGGLNEAYEVGDIMVIDDHLNLPGLAGHTPLRRAPSAGEVSPFVSLIDAYDPVLRALAHRAAQETGDTLRRGTYAMVAGPSYETIAEARVLRALGADAVGMSTVPEVVEARRSGLRVLALSTITNVILPGEGGVDHSEVLAAGHAAAPRLSRLFRSLIPELPEALRS